MKKRMFNVFLIEEHPQKLYFQVNSVMIGASFDNFVFVKQEGLEDIKALVTSELEIILN